MKKVLISIFLLSSSMINCSQDPIHEAKQLPAAQRKQFLDVLLSIENEPKHGPHMRQPNFAQYYTNPVGYIIDNGSGGNIGPQIKKLIDANAEIDAPDSHGRTPLFLAVNKIIAYQTAQAANRDESDRFKSDGIALQYQKKIDNMHLVVKSLLECSADPRIAADQTEEFDSALSRAVFLDEKVHEKIRLQACILDEQENPKQLEKKENGEEKQ